MSTSLLERMREFYGFDPTAQAPGIGQKFDLFTSIDIASGGVGTFVSIRLGVNEWIRFSLLGMEADTNGLVGFQDVAFEILVNRHPDEFYRNMVDQLGRGQDPAPINLIVTKPGAEIIFRATNSHSSTTTRTFGRLVGWTIPLPGGGG